MKDPADGPELQAALKGYLREYHPDDVSSLQMVSAHFVDHYVVGQERLLEAKQLVKTVNAENVCKDSAFQALQEALRVSHPSFMVTYTYSLTSVSVSRHLLKQCLDLSSVQQQHEQANV